MTCNGYSKGVSILFSERFCFSHIRLTLTLCYHFREIYDLTIYCMSKSIEMLANFQHEWQV